MCVWFAGGPLACRVARWLVVLFCGLVLLSVGVLAGLLVGGGFGWFVGWLVGWLVGLSGVDAEVAAWPTIGNPLCNCEINRQTANEEDTCCNMNITYNIRRKYQYQPKLEV